MQKAGIKTLKVPLEYLLDKVIAKPVIDKKTGEVLAAANAEITAELINQFYKSGIESFETLYVNDLGSITRCICYI